MPLADRTLTRNPAAGLIITNPGELNDGGFEVTHLPAPHGTRSETGILAKSSVAPRHDGTSPGARRATLSETARAIAERQMI